MPDATSIGANELVSLAVGGTTTRYRWDVGWNVLTEAYATQTVWGSKRMTGRELAQALVSRLYPEPYNRLIQPSGSFDFLVMHTSLWGGRYALAFRCYTENSAPETLKRSRMEARRLTHAIYPFRSVGLYLVLCGPSSAWKHQKNQRLVDSTGFHSVIVQAVHFVDPETGENYLSRSAWGPITFGGLVPTSELVGEVINRIPNPG